MTLRTGDIVERYQLQERLGAGSFGEVWRASQLADRKDVGVVCALKLMRLAQGRASPGSHSFAGGWLDEVRNLVRLGGDIIPRIFEANVWNDYAYIAMEMLEGTTLAARLAHGPVPWRRALFIADQIARALFAAHQSDVVHRDLKPQNIMLVGPRRVCIIDWGIASLRASAAPPAAQAVSRLPTTECATTDDLPIEPILAPQRPRGVFGTPGYMAPEVYEGVLPAPAQDLYALGVVLYEMMAGCLPYAVDLPSPPPTAPDAVKAYRASLETATQDHALIPLRDRCPDIPRGVAQLVDQLLAREPERRPQHLLSALERAQQFPHGVPDPPYVGLGTMESQHSGFFFGQHEAIQHVLDRLRTDHGALLWGPSGSGKSSLALAGVAATMDRTLFLDTDGWEVHVLRPREAHSFRVVPGAASRPQGTIGQIVVLNQLEEIVDLEPPARDRFCAAVLALLDRSAAVQLRATVIGVADQVKVVATIRDDLEWRVDREVPALRPLLGRRVLVKGVDVNFARKIIEQPARTVDYRIEGIDEVSREIEDCLSGQPTKLPMVQYALSEWWERRDQPRRVLPIAAWNEIGGVDGALSFAAERLFSALDLAQRLRMRTLFVRMLAGGRKQPLVESELVPEDLEVLDALVRLRLVGRRERKDNEPAYEVEHEALAEHWSRLSTWLVEAREDRALADELERDAAAYARDHDAERLWEGRRIAAVTEMETRGRTLISVAATRFLNDARRRKRQRWLATRLLIGLGVAAAIIGGRFALFDTGVAHEYAQVAAQLQQAERDNQRLEQRSVDLYQKLRSTQDANHDLQRNANALELRIQGERASCTRELQAKQASLSMANAERDTARSRGSIDREAATIEHRNLTACEQKRYEAEHMQRVAEQALTSCANRK